MSEKTANPAPLGLLGFGMTTILLNFVHNARLGPIDGMIFGIGIFYGGLAQIIAGVLEYKKGNTFGTTAFTSYGLFWLSFVALNWLGSTSVASSGIWPFSSYGPAISGYNTPWFVSQEAFMAYFFMCGNLHLRHVLWCNEKEPRLTICFHEPCNTVLSAYS